MAKPYGTGYTAEDAEKQAHKAMQNAQELPEEAGASFDDARRTRIYI